MLGHALHVRFQWRSIARHALALTTVSSSARGHKLEAKNVVKLEVARSQRTVSMIVALPVLLNGLIRCSSVAFWIFPVVHGLLCIPVSVQVFVNTRETGTSLELA